MFGEIRKQRSCLVWKTADVKRRGFVVGNVGQAYLYTYRMTQAVSHMHCPISHSDQKNGQTPGMFVLDPLPGLVSFELCHLARGNIKYLVKADGRAQTQNDSYPGS